MGLERAMTSILILGGLGGGLGGAVLAWQAGASWLAVLGAYSICGAICLLLAGAVGAAFGPQGTPHRGAARDRAVAAGRPPRLARTARPGRSSAL